MCGIVDPATISFECSFPEVGGTLPSFKAVRGASSTISHSDLEQAQPKEKTEETKRASPKCVLLPVLTPLCERPIGTEITQKRSHSCRWNRRATCEDLSRDMKNGFPEKWRPKFLFSSLSANQSVLTHQYIVPRFISLSDRWDTSMKIPADR